MKAAALLLLALAFTPEVARAADDRPPVVAVFEIRDTTGRPKALMASLTDYLRVKIAETRAMRVIDKSQQERELKSLVQSQKAESYKNCYDEACQIPLGKELAADKILRGQLSRVGKVFVLSLELIDLASNTTSGAASAKSDGREDSLLTAVEQVADKIVREGRPAAKAPEKVVERPVERAPDPPPPVVAQPAVAVAPPPVAPAPQPAAPAPPPAAPGPQRGVWNKIGTDVRMVAADGANVYTLKVNGNIESLKADGGWEVFDPATDGTKQLCAANGWAYALKTSGNLWRRTKATAWAKWDDGTGTKQVVAAQSTVYVMKDDSKVYRRVGEGGWEKIDSAEGSNMLAVDLQNNLFVLKNNGNIWRYGGYGEQWNQVDSGTNTKWIAAADNAVYVLKDNGNVWKVANGAATQMDAGTGAKQLCADRHLLYILKDNGNVYQVKNGAAVMIDNGTGTRQIACSAGSVYVVKEDNLLWRNWIE